ncbi:MAG TPA: O-antigen ligase family protein [Opitutaceae bacterium]|nr:O-antigen ligase family protein [Opitutaceae bacterium]
MGAEGLGALAIFVPILTGLEKSDLLHVADLSLVVFGGYLLALQARNPSIPLMGVKSDETSRPWALAAELLLLAVTLSLAWQIVRHASPALWAESWCQSVFRFGNPFSFLTAGYLLMMGLAFFRLLLDQGPLLEAWLLPALLAQLAATAAFFLLQWFAHFPEAYGGIICFLPYEDISSFGSAAASSFMFFAALCFRPGSGRRLATFGFAVAAAVALALDVASWSRGAWLSTAIGLACLAWLMLPRRLTAALLIAALAAIIWVNRNADNPAWNEHPFAWRLIRLVRLENPVNKDPSRFTLYRKAAAMIIERPWIGHGVGSFYLESVRYGPRNDPYALVPDYAHDAWLLIAAELGLPVATLAGVMVIFALRRGLGGAERGNPDSLRFAAAASLLTYVLTQVTANSLTEYPSNQFLFWLLIAALLGNAAKDALQLPGAVTLR